MANAWVNALFARVAHGGLDKLRILVTSRDRLASPDFRTRTIDVEKLELSRSVELLQFDKRVNGAVNELERIAEETCFRHACTIDLVANYIASHCGRKASIFLGQGRSIAERFEAASTFAPLQVVVSKYEAAFSESYLWLPDEPDRAFSLWNFVQVLALLPNGIPRSQLDEFLSIWRVDEAQRVGLFNMLEGADDLEACTMHGAIREAILLTWDGEDMLSTIRATSRVVMKGRGPNIDDSAARFIIVELIGRLLHSSARRTKWYRSSRNWASATNLYLREMGGFQVICGQDADYDSALRVADYFEEYLADDSVSPPSGLAFLRLCIDLGLTRCLQGNLNQATSHFEAALALCSESDTLPVIRANVLQNLGMVHMLRDDLATALEYFDDSLAALGTGSSDTNVRYWQSVSHLAIGVCTAKIGIMEPAQDRSVSELLQHTCSSLDALNVQQLSGVTREAALRPFWQILAARGYMNLLDTQRLKRRVKLACLGRESLEHDAQITARLLKGELEIAPLHAVYTAPNEEQLTRLIETYNSLLIIRDSAHRQHLGHAEASASTLVIRILTLVQRSGGSQDFPEDLDAAFLSDLRGLEDHASRCTKDYRDFGEVQAVLALCLAERDLDVHGDIARSWSRLQQFLAESPPVLLVDAKTVDKSAWSQFLKRALRNRLVQTRISWINEVLYWQLAAECAFACAARWNQEAQNPNRLRNGTGKYRDIGVMMLDQAALVAERALDQLGSSDCDSLVMFASGLSNHLNQRKAKAKSRGFGGERGRRCTKQEILEALAANRERPGVSQLFKLHGTLEAAVDEYYPLSQNVLINSMRATELPTEGLKTENRKQSEVRESLGVGGKELESVLAALGKSLATRYELQNFFMVEMDIIPENHIPLHATLPEALNALVLHVATRRRLDELLVVAQKRFPENALLSGLAPHETTL